MPKTSILKLNPVLYLLIVGLVFSVFIFIGSVVYTLKTEENLVKDFNTIEDTHMVMNDLKKLANLVDNLENSYRIYRLSADSYFLTEFNYDEKLIIKELIRIRTSYNLFNKEDRQKLSDLNDYINERINMARLKIEKQKENFNDVNIDNESLQKEAQLKIKIFTILNELIKSQQDMLDQQHDNILHKFENTKNTISTVGISAGLLTILIVLFLYQYNKTHFKIERDLTLLNENKNKFFSIISHDLRGPVKNIVLMAKLLYQQDNKTIDKEKIAKMIESSSANLSALLDNLLKWSRLQMNKMEFEAENVNMGKLAEDVINNLQVHIQQKNISISSTIPHNYYVYADQNMVATVLRNLISNSLKFTEKGGSIKLSAYKDSSRVTVIVEDTGVGMPKEIADRIFDINFKHSTKGTNKEEGSGLGLKLCKEFVEKNNGSIRVESTVGVGSKFIFTLPTGEEIA